MVGIIPKNTSSSVDVMRVEKAPVETYADVGGLDDQIMEIKVELVLVFDHLFYIHIPLFLSPSLPLSLYSSIPHI